MWVLEIFLYLQGTKQRLIMEKLRRAWEYIRLHKYLITIVAFLLIIGFLDENNLIRRFSHQREINELKSEIAKYKKQYEEDSKTTNPEVLEKVAREKYLMKKQNEDIYIFEE